MTLTGTVTQASQRVDAEPSCDQSSRASPGSIVVMAPAILDFEASDDRIRAVPPPSIRRLYTFRTMRIGHAAARMTWWVVDPNSSRSLAPRP